jgi:hypothetical protein
MQARRARLAEPLDGLGQLPIALFGARDALRIGTSVPQANRYDRRRVFGAGAPTPAAAWSGRSPPSPVVKLRFGRQPACRGAVPTARGALGDLGRDIGPQPGSAPSGTAHNHRTGCYRPVHGRAAQRAGRFGAKRVAPGEGRCLNAQ